MNRTQDLNQAARIFKLKTELGELKEAQQNFTKADESWWELDMKIKANEIILKNLTSVCIYCQKNWANFDLENGKLAHWECYEKYWELMNNGEKEQKFH